MNLKSLSTLGVGVIVAALQCISPSTHAALVAHFKLDEGSLDPFTNTVYSSVTPNSGAFTATFPTWSTTGLAPVPASEGGTTAHVQFSTSSSSYIITDFYGPTGAVARSVSAWVKFPASFQTTATTQPGIVSYGTTTPNTTRYTLTLDTSTTPKGKLRFEIAGANMVGSTVVADGAWHHVAMTCPDNARMSNVVLYVDGARQTFTGGSLGTLLATSTGTSAVIPVYIGATVHNLGLVNGGEIDEVKIYNHQLSDNDVLQLVFGAGFAPTIGQQPVDAFAVLGITNGLVSFSAALSSGSPPITYQWKRNGVNIPGATDQLLTVAPVTAADIGAYSVGITNPYGGALSSSASLSWSTPPVDPVEQTILVGSNATFTVTMPSDSSGYTYQWLKGGSDISGATSSSCQITGASAGDAANYAVRVNLSGQTATSAPAPLAVLSVPASAYAQQVLSSGPAAYWRLGELNGAAIAADVTGFHQGYFSNFAGVELQSPGAVTNDANTAAQFNNNNYVEVPYSPALQDYSYSLEAWVLPDDASGRHSVICSRSQYLSRGYELCSSSGSWQFRTGNQDTSFTEIWNDLTAGTVTLGAWQHLVATYDGSTKRLYVNGQLAASQTIVAKPTDQRPLRIGAGRTYGTAGDFFSGKIDEAAVYWRALTEEEIAVHYSVGAFGNNVRPFLLSDISSRTNYVGAYVTFRAAAQGSYPLSYQWTRYGTNLPGATTTVLTLPHVQLSDAGPYALKVSNGSGSTNTSTATLTVLPITQTGYRGLVMNDGPVAYYPLDELNYNPIAAELLNFGVLDGIYSGSPLEGEAGATTSTGTSVLFDGASQAVLLGSPDALNLSGQVSLEAWVKPLTNYAGGGFGNIIAHGHSAAPTRELVLRVSSGLYQMHTYDGATYGANLSVPSSDIGNWVHLVGTYDGAYWRIYRNGALAVATSSAVGAFTVNAEWAIGARGGGTERFFSGGIDEAAIYPYALGGDQVAKHYFAATGQTGQLGISKSGTNVVLTWNAGLLESAASVAGPWTTVTNAVSPRTVPATAAQGFYRLRW